MAYVSQDLKAKLAPTIKAICKKYNVKASLAVSNHMALVLNIKSAPIDFIENYNATVGKRFEHDPASFHKATGSIDINEYWFHEQFDGNALNFLSEIIPALKGPDYYNNDDAQTDYFDRSHYIGINVGKWDKPFEFTPA